MLDKNINGGEFMSIEELAEVIFHQFKPNSSSSLAEVLNEFNRGEIGTLSYLAFDKNKVSAGELSEKLNVTTARIACILNSLENKQYIERKEDEKDKRKTLVYITEKGKNLACDAKKEVIEKIIKVIEEIGYDEIKNYINVVARIKKILEEQ